MPDLTIDVYILRSGSGTGNMDYFESCYFFLKKSLKKNSFKVALDKKGKIRYQYDKQLKEGTYGHHWLSRMAKADRISTIPWQHIDRGTRTALMEAHFHPEDFKYVETAAATDIKSIATHDPDYSPKVRRILDRRLEIMVLDSQKCIDTFCT
jgi:hypothetical protein